MYQGRLELHPNMLQVLAGKGPKLVLDLPAACFRPELEPSISAIMRHILEDPATLQAAMEAEIRATLSKQKTPANRSGDPPSSPKDITNRSLDKHPCVLCAHTSSQVHLRPQEWQLGMHLLSFAVNR